MTLNQVQEETIIKLQIQMLQSLFPISVILIYMTLLIKSQSTQYTYY